MGIPDTKWGTQKVDSEVKRFHRLRHRQFFNLLWMLLWPKFVMSMNVDVCSRKLALISCTGLRKTIKQRELAYFEVSEVFSDKKNGDYTIFNETIQLPLKHLQSCSPPGNPPFSAHLLPTSPISATNKWGENLVSADFKHSLIKKKKKQSRRPGFLSRNVHAGIRNSFDQQHKLPE